MFCFWPPVLYPTYLCLFDTIKTAESRGLSCSTGKGGLYDNVVETGGGRRPLHRSGSSKSYDEMAIKSSRYYSLIARRMALNSKQVIHYW